MQADARRVVTIGVIALVILWLMVDRLPLPENTRKAIKNTLTWAVALTVAGALGVVAVIGAPWWVAAGGAAAVLGTTAAGQMIGRLVGDELEGKPGDSVRCGDPGTCGEVIDGAVCLSLSCPTA